MSARDDLIKALARTVHTRRALADQREEVLARAIRQLDAAPGYADDIADHLEAGLGGGVLGHRALETVVHDRAKLERLVAKARS